MTEPIERIAVLEALRIAHEDRHERHEKLLSAAFGKIDTQFTAGLVRFDKIDTSLIELKRSICNGSHKHDTNGNTIRTKPRDFVLRIGAPVLGGGGLAGIVYLIMAFVG